MLCCSIEEMSRRIINSYYIDESDVEPQPDPSFASFEEMSRRIIHSSTSIDESDVEPQFTRTCHYNFTFLKKSKRLLLMVDFHLNSFLE